MAAGTPLTRLTLGAASVTDDLGYVALSDLARVLGDIAADCHGRLSHMSSGRPDTTIPLRPAVADGQVKAEEMTE